MGLDDPPRNLPKSSPFSKNPSKRPNSSKEAKFHTTEYKKPPKPHKNELEKYATTPANLEKAAANLDKKILVSLISQSEYMKRHLCIKTGVDRERPVLRYQVKKVSIRNYTPKAINQDINMGMWI